MTFAILDISRKARIKIICEAGRREVLSAATKARRQRAKEERGQPLTFYILLLSISSISFSVFKNIAGARACFLMFREERGRVH